MISLDIQIGNYHADAQKVLSFPLARIVIDDGRRFLDGAKPSYIGCSWPLAPPPIRAPIRYASVSAEISRAQGFLDSTWPVELNCEDKNGCSSKAERIEHPRTRYPKILFAMVLRVFCSLRILRFGVRGGLAATRDGELWGDHGPCFHSNFDVHGRSGPGLLGCGSIDTPGSGR
jgi:hypothetical protein